MGKTDECETFRGHETHLCELRRRGAMEELDRRSNQPTVVCDKCGAKANDGRDLCQPRPIRP